MTRHHRSSNVFRLSALAAAIMSINSMSATAAQCVATDGVVSLDGASCENTQILENTTVEMTGVGPAFTNDNEIIGTVSVPDLDSEAIVETVLIEGGSGASVTNTGDIVADNTNTDAAADDIAIGVMISTDETEAGPVNLSGVVVNNTGDIEADNAAGGAVGILVEPDLNELEAPLGTITDITINNGSATVSDSNIQASSTDEGAAGVLVLGEQVTSGVTIDNKGAISAEGVRSFGVGLEDLKAWLEGAPSATLSNSGTIGMIAGDGVEGEPDYDPPVLAKVGVSVEDAEADQYVVINNAAGGKIVGTEIGVEVGAVDFETSAVVGAGTVDINNDGTIDGGETGTGIKITGDSAVTITNTSTTTIKGAIGIDSSSTSDALDNHDPEGAEVGAGGYSVIVLNTGTIEGTGGDAIQQSPTTDTLSSDGKMIVVNNGNIVGNVTLITEGSYLAMESGSIEGDVHLKAIDAVGMGAELDFESGVISGDVIGNDTGSVAFDGETGDRLLEGGITNVGSIDFEGGSSTVEGDINAPGAYLETFDGAVAILNGSAINVAGVENGGDIHIAGILTVGADGYVGTDENDANGTLYFVIDPEGTSGKLVSSVVTLGDTEALGAKTVTPAEEGAAFHVVEATTLNLPTDTAVEDLDVQWAGGLNRYVAVAGDDSESLGADATGDANDVFFIAQGVALEEAVTDPKLTGLVKVLSPLLSDPPPELEADPGFQKLLEVLATGDNAAIARTLREVSQKGVVGSVASGAMGGGGGNGKGGGGGAGGGVETAFLRLDEIRLAESIEDDRGVNTGDRAAASRGFWVRTGYTQANQDERDGVDGYKADTGTFSMGVDTEVTGGGTVGLAYLYADSEVEPDGPKSTIDVATHAFTVYGSTKVAGQGVDLALTYADHGFDSARTMTGFTGQAKADYDGNTWALRIGSEWDRAMARGWNLVPSVAMTWSETEVDSYRETATGTMLAMDVKMDDINALVGKAGVALKGKFKSAGTTWAPKVFANVYHDFEGEQPSASVAFASAAGSRFNSEGAEPEKTLYELGFGLTGYQSSNLKLTGQYGYSTQNDFAGHALSLTARLRY